MRIDCWLIFTGVLGASVAYGQVKRQFNVENTQACESIKLCLKANSGNCYIKPSHNPDLLNVFSNQNEESFSHNFVKEIKGSTCEVSLALEEMKSNGISQTISARMFGPSEKNTDEKYWKMYLTNHKPYMLEMAYGVGNANIDLSGLSIKKLKINTGSADVNVGYYSLENMVDMDTFMVKVDLGTVHVMNVNLSRSQHVIADVGFGNLTLDFSGQPLVNNTVKGSVGAGNLIILLPDKDIPVLIKIHDSWLCSIAIPDNLKKVASNTFANEAYKKNSSNPLTFDLDVSMGKIMFKETN